MNEFEKTIAELVDKITGDPPLTGELPEEWEPKVIKALEVAVELKENWRCLECRQASCICT